MSSLPVSTGAFAPRATDDGRPGSNPIGPLPAHLTQVGGDPQLAAKELLHTIAESITRQPRTLQKAIGPSEIGQACARRLGYKLLGTPERERPPAWKPTVGTAVHAHLEGVFDAYNVANAHLMGGQERYLIETRVTVGTINGEPVTGTCDLYDRVTCTSWDWKCVGPTQLTKYKRQGPGPQYEAQAHLYGQGWWNAGLVCTHVGVVFLPRNGELKDAHVWTAPFDPVVASDALRRVEGVAIATGALGTAALASLPTADDWCSYCPFFRKDSTDLADGCPGHPSAAVQDTGNQLSGLIPA